MKKIDKYEVCGLLGKGGMGMVYKVRMPVVGKVVALKLLSPHPNLVTLLGEEKIKRPQNGAPSYERVDKKPHDDGRQGHERIQESYDQVSAREAMPINKKRERNSEYRGDDRGGACDLEGNRNGAIHLVIAAEYESDCVPEGI